MAAERVVVTGGGIGGLAVALTAAKGDREVVIVERDPEPPVIAPEAAFEAWSRPGVPQFRHAHILLARVQTLLRDHHPEVLADLRQAGLELSTVEEGLPSNLRPSFRPMPGDDDLMHLWGRRPTFEYVLRRHAGRLPNVRFIHSAQVVGLLTEAKPHTLHARGLEFTRLGKRESIEADVVVDASGRSSKMPQWLEAKGVRVVIDSNPSGFIYACRHYRLKDPLVAPSRMDTGGNLDYLGYSAFYAEHGHYALTFGCPVEETELSAAICCTEGFEALCEQFPVLTRLTSASEATSKVLGAGRFENRWTRFGVRGGRELLGFFAVGDAHIETNPMYGRGCASAFLQAHVLSHALQASDDPRTRARHYHGRTRELLQPYFDISVSTDRVYHIRAKLSRGLAIPPGDRVFNYMYETAWLPAMNASLLVAREFLKAVEMREISSLGLRLAMAAHILAALFRNWLGRRNAPAEATRPTRSEFLRSLAATRRGDPSE